MRFAKFFLLATIVAALTVVSCGESTTEPNVNEPDTTNVNNFYRGHIRGFYFKKGNFAAKAWPYMIRPKADGFDTLQVNLYNDHQVGIDSVKIVGYHTNKDSIDIEVYDWTNSFSGIKVDTIKFSLYKCDRKLIWY